MSAQQQHRWAGPVLGDQLVSYVAVDDGDAGRPARHQSCWTRLGAFLVGVLLGQRLLPGRRQATVPLHAGAAQAASGSREPVGELRTGGSPSWR